jgi:small subunit ribosomal protein S6
MMRKYEALLLTVPEITADEVKSIETQVDKEIKQVNGSIILFDRWGKYKLAYPVRKNEYGVYFLVRFELPQEAKVLEALKALFAVKLYSVIMRHMISVLDPQAGTAYQRPPSLEETPAREAGSFYKDRQEGGFSRGPCRRFRDQFSDEEGGEHGDFKPSEQGDENVLGDE